MLSILKDIPNLGLYFIIWGLAAYWLTKKKHKSSTLVIVIGIVLFLVCSTNYVPKRLIASIEKAYDPIDLHLIDDSQTYYIHVLGSGANNQLGLPATMNLNSATLSRLVEGIRIHRNLDHAVLVTSAASEKGLKSQAEMSKESAVLLGVKEEDIKMLVTPTTTLEEALAFKEEFGTNKNLIVVTSALHMPRAVEIFGDQGLKVIPAPSSYFYIDDGYRNNGVTLPSFGSLELMNDYHITQLKHWYYRIFKKERKREIE